MTFVFRSSSFFVVFVITLKATTFVVGNTTGGNSAADRFNGHVERLVDEAVRFRGEAREVAERSADMAFALHVMGDRVIECAGTVCGVVERGVLAALRRVARLTHANFGNATCTSNIGSAMPIKEVKRGSYTAAGQCG